MPAGLEAILEAETQLSSQERLTLLEQSLARLAADYATLPDPAVRQQAVRSVETVRRALRAMADAWGLESAPRPPKRSFYGALAHLGPAPSAEEIDEMRREAWANFPREDA